MEKGHLTIFVDQERGVDPASSRKEISHAVALAKWAVYLSCETSGSWNTLALGHCRAAVGKTLLGPAQKSIELSNGCSTFDWIVSAMDYGRLNEMKEA